MPPPKDTPLHDWLPGWLKMEVASILGISSYVIMHDHEKLAVGYPVTPDEMRNFIRAARKKQD